MRDKFAHYLKKYSLSLLKKGDNESNKNINLKYDNSIFSPSVVQGNKDRDDFLELMLGYQEKGYVSVNLVQDDNAFIRWKITNNQLFHKEFNIMSDDEKIEAILKEIDMNNFAFILLKRYIGSSNKAHQETVNLFKVINTLTDKNFAGGDLRTLSVQIFTDDQKDMSKQLEKYLNNALSIIGKYFSISDIQLLREKYKITKYPPSVSLSGSFEILMDDMKISGNMPPYVNIHPEQIEYLINTGFARVLTIENKTSFERYVREVKDPSTLVIFTHGNPSCAIQDLVSKIAHENPDIKFYHWGDIDITGIQIVLTLIEKTNKEVYPIGASVEDISNFGKNAENEYAKEQKRFDNTITRISNLHYFDLYTSTLLNNIRMEQENISPCDVFKQLSNEL